MNTLDIGICVILCISLLFNIFFYEDIKGLRSDVATYKSEISQLKTDSEQEAKKVAEALITAQKQMQQVQSKSDGILKEKVSNDCNKSIKWLAEQAILL